MKLFVLSHPDYFLDELQVVTALFEAGLELFHLRKPGLSAIELDEYLASLPSKHHGKIVIHTHYSLTEKYSLKGIHSNEPVEECYHDKLVSRSVHSFDEINSLPARYEYVFLGPVFDSISKPGYKGKIGLHNAKESIKKSPVRIVALGGIDEKNIHSVNSAGFHGAALLGAVWQHSNPVNQFTKIRHKIINSPAHLTTVL